MITFKKNVFSSAEINLKFIPNETLFDLRARASGHLAPHYCVVVDGKLIEEDFLFKVVAKEASTILVAPHIRGGSGMDVFKQVAIIVAVVVVTYATKGLVGPEIAAGLAAGAGLATSLILNALIPPIIPGFAGGDFGESFSDSQMYTISSQQNTVKKFGFVPKVYGKHRIYPVVASNPYTEIETNPDTGELVQYFYAIYDFGFGPAFVRDLKIGDSPISSFSDVQYRFVDLNRPSVVVGEWDEYLNTSFELYKGDIQSDAVGASLNGNRDAGDPQSEWQLLRTASPSDGSKMEIMLNFLCPKGLTCYGTTGSRAAVSINVDVEFSKVGEDIWYGYNDRNMVERFEAIGSATGIQNRVVPGVVPGFIADNHAGTITPTNGYILLSKERYSYQYKESGQGNYQWVEYDGLRHRIGIPRGTTVIKTTYSGVKPTGSAVTLNGTFIGHATWNLVGGYWEATLAAPTPTHIELLVVSIIRKERDQLWNYVREDSRVNPVLVVAEIDSGKLLISRNSTEAVYATVKFVPKVSGDYKLRIRRTSTSKPYTYQVLDELGLMSISTRFDRKPITTTKRHVFLELRIRATNQLNGTISNLSGVVSSVLPVWNGTTWDLEESNNPAWVFADMLAGEVNKKRLPLNRLETDSLLEWANYCDAVPSVVYPPDSPNYGFPPDVPRYTCNFILDFNTTLQSLLSSVSSASQASLSLIDGKYGVLLDKARTVPVQLFTPRNSWGFSSTRNYQDKVGGVLVKYIDGDTWEVSEIEVRADNYNGEEITESLEAFACTNREQAWRYGRYMLAQLTLRQENISINVDFEHLVCTRGDFVKIVQDTMLVGGMPARVRSIVGNVATLDANLTEAPTGYAVRTISGVFVGEAESVSSNEVRLLGDLPSVGDLIVVGAAENITLDCIVKSISVNADMTATLTLVEKNDAVFLAETGAPIPEYNAQIGVVRSSELLAPPPVTDLAVTDSGWDCADAGYYYFVDLMWSLPVGAVYSAFEIYVDSGSGLVLHDTTTTRIYTYKTVSPGEFTFAVVAVGADGDKITVGEAVRVSETISPKISPPSNVEFLAINITNETLQLNWKQVADCDVKEYLIRYSPSPAGTWEASIPLLRVDRNTTMAVAQARTGTYLIKAVDFGNNESDLSAAAITSIPSLTGLNVISQTTDFPSLPGELVACEKDGDTIVLKHLSNSGVETSEYFSEGYYYYANFLDLGEVYTVRLQSQIEAEGFTVGDLMSSWATLSDLVAMSQSRFSEWDVETQVRVTDTFNVINEWTSLSDVAQMSEGDEDNWSEWRQFTIGDFTGRIMQFRLKLISNKPSVTPRVFSGEIRADMPDRIESANDVLCPVDGVRVQFNPAFKAVPAVAITIDGASAGDHYLVSDKTIEGFNIVFYDNNNVQVQRQFDWMAKGYGRQAVESI